MIADWGRIGRWAREGVGLTPTTMTEGTGALATSPHLRVSPDHRMVTEKGNFALQDKL